jgi:ankyrin repeat protein
VCVLICNFGQDKGNTALCRACAENNSAAVELLIQHDTDLFIQNRVSNRIF